MLSQLRKVFLKNIVIQVLGKKGEILSPANKWGNKRIGGKEDQEYFAAVKKYFQVTFKEGKEEVCSVNH